MNDTTTTTEDHPPGAQGAAPVTLDLGDLADDWQGMAVTIRPHLSYAASQRITGAAAKATAEVAASRAQRRARDDDDALEVVNTITPIEFAVATVEECVLSWTLVGYDRRPITPDRAGVQSPQAPSHLIEAVIDEIHHHYEAAAPKLRKRR